MEPSQLTLLSVEHCKDLLRMIGKMYCIKAELLSTRLLSKEDKQDMLDGLISIECLASHVAVWKEDGMPNYSEGKFERYEQRWGISNR